MARGSHSNFGLGRVTCQICGKPVITKQAAELRQDAPNFEPKVWHLDCRPWHVETRIVDQVATSDTNP